MSKITDMINSSDPEMRTFGLFLQKRETAEKNLNLEYVHRIMRDNPDVIIGGSLGLFLQDVWLERWLDAVSDLDIIIPTDFKAVGTIKYTKKDQSDFDFRFEISDAAGSVLVDVLIDPYAKSEIVTYGDRQYRVAPLAEILAAKCRYSLEGKTKHTEDIREICSAIAIKRKEMPASVSWGIGS